MRSRSKGATHVLVIDPATPPQRSILPVRFEEGLFRAEVAGELRFLEIAARLASSGDGAGVIVPVNHLRQFETFLFDLRIIITISATKRFQRADSLACAVNLSNEINYIITSRSIS